MGFVVQSALSPRDPSFGILTASPFTVFAVLITCVAFVGDGWSGRPGGVVHQVLLLPFTVLFLAALRRLLASGSSGRSGSAQAVAWWAVAFEGIALLAFFYESRHFGAFGYHLGASWATFLVCSVFAAVIVGAALRRHSPATWIVVSVVIWLLGVATAVRNFPLHYLRSDMLPVIQWADARWLNGGNPYGTMHVGDRVYDFPYLPGLLIAYLPFVWANLDLRIGTAVYLSLAVALVWWATTSEKRAGSAMLLSLFLLNPYLQYRHDLYQQPHWFCLALSFVLLSRGSIYLAALCFGLGMGLYQFSWIAFPFLVLYIGRRRGWLAATGSAAVGLSGMALLFLPVITSLRTRVVGNTVGQWGLRARPLADPINVSYWASWIVPPAHLLRLQLILMVAIFGYCLWRKRCQTLADCTRWMVVAVTVFVLFNVIVDGYFFLMILWLLLLHLCSAWGLWPDPDGDVPPAELLDLRRA